MRLLCVFVLAVSVPGWLLSADEHELTQTEREQLDRDKVLIGNREYRQSFEPYISNRIPVFVTSDAVLNAFHVIFEESLAGLEAANAARLEALLGRIVANLPSAVAELKGAEQWKAGAARRAEIMIKVALRLTGERAPGSNKEIERIIAAQVKEIEAGTGQSKPAWLGLPDDGFFGLDFTRFTPRGFYTRTTRMQRYFRAVAWLQSVPFRVLQTEEFLAARLIGRAAFLGQPRAAWIYAQREPFLDSWNAIIGGRDDADLKRLLDSGRNAEGLDLREWKSVREFQEREASDLARDMAPRVNDTIRFPPAAQAGKPGKAEPEYRLLSAAALPDAAMMQRTSQPRGADYQRYPDPLEVAAGLGSSFASDTLSAALPAEDWAGMQAPIRALSKRPTSDSLYEQYLQVLGELVNEPEPDAPEFLRGVPWRRKSAHTLLGSWAQMRHALVLQAKTNQFYAGLTEVPPGFVEPDPEFFRRLGELCVRCLALFSESSAFDENSEPAIMDSLMRARDSADRLSRDGNDDERSATYDIGRVFNRAGGDFPMPEEPEYPVRKDGMSDAEFKRMHQAHDKKMAVYHGRLRDALSDLIRRIESAPAQQRTAMLRKLHLAESDSLAGRWEGLARLCSRAQSIAHRQLRKVELTDEEKVFLRDFGFQLASAMFYDGNSYEAPRDDAPRVVDVFSGPQGHLHVGTGRPRALYVLYPHKGTEVRCVGAVLPFYSFKEGPERLTDVKWRERLKSNAPPCPQWIAPICAPPKPRDR